MDNVLAVEHPLVVEVEHPLWDAHPRLAPAVRLSRSRTVAPAGCLCGQHTHELLLEFGYSESEIDHMRKEGIVQ
jgi:crotonobetainyl-CoA:carnitine CoA-transferase CaiB-like acyl-CoA transferase